MSVLGIGLDLVATSRIAEILHRHRARFLERCFRQVPASRDSEPEQTARLAARWAAKEAFLKALGTDVRAVPYRDVEVVDSPTGPPELILHGRALAALKAAGGRRLHLALGREGAHALALVIIET